MASRLVVDSRDGWLTPGSASDPRLFHADPSDRILLYPAGVGEGYRQYITLSDDLTLVIMNYIIQREVVINGAIDAEIGAKFEFPIINRSGEANGAGQCSRFFPIFGSNRVGAMPNAQPVLELEVIFRGYGSLLSYFQTCIERYPPHAQEVAMAVVRYWWQKQGGRAELSPDAIARRVQTRLERGSPVFNDDCDDSAMPDRLYMSMLDVMYANCTTITPEMAAIVGQILSCPYRGQTRRQHLQQKALELVALRIESIATPTLRPDDLDCIYRAAAILRSDLVRPPSIESLARQAHTNRLKLNQGFHAVYGTTPYQYLRDSRLWMAQRLLATSTLSVGKIATAVGYSSRNHFAKAFRNQTGLNPKLFQMQAWPEAS